MTLIDFIELSDNDIDIIDLSSDEDTVQEDQIAAQHRAALLDRQGMFFLASEGSQGVQAVFVAAGKGSQDVQAVFVAASEGSQDVQAVSVAASEGREEIAAPLNTAKSPYCHRSPTSAPLPSLTSTTLKAQTSEGGDIKSVNVKAKYHKKNYHTNTPRRSPRLTQMGSCCASPVEEPAADHKRSRTLGPAEEAASERRQEAAEPGHALGATSSSMVMEKAPPVAGSEGSQDVHAVSVAAGEGGQEAGESGHALEATASSMVMEKTTLVAASEGSQDVQPVLVAAGEGGQEAAESEHALEATTLSWVIETPPLNTAKSPYCHRTPTSAPLPSLTSTTLKAQTSEGGNIKSVNVKAKYRKKNYRTNTPRKSPRLTRMGSCCASPVEEPATDHKRSRMLGPAEEAAASTDSAGTVVLALSHAGSTNCLRSPTSATFHSLTSISTKAVTSEGGDAMLVSGRVKHPERNYHIVSLVMEKPPLGPTSTSPKALSSEGGDAKLVSGKVKHRRKNCQPCKLTP